jgi:hypothetical protein
LNFLALKNKQLIIIKYIKRSECGDVAGEPLIIQCVYSAGLEGIYDSNYQDNFSLIFINPTGFIDAEKEGASVFNPLGSVVRVEGLIYINSNGDLDTLSTLVGAPFSIQQITAVSFGKDGNIYVSGNFTTIGGVAANYIAYWNGTAWNAMGSGLSGVAPYALKIYPLTESRLIVVGMFTGAGGVANTNKAALWDGSNWFSIGAFTVASGISDVIFHKNFYYFAGDITTVNGVAVVGICRTWDFITYYAITGTSQVVSYVNGSGKILVSCDDGFLYLVRNVAGVYKVSRWDGTTLTDVYSISTLLTTVEILSLMQLQSGKIYAIEEHKDGAVPSNNITRIILTIGKSSSVIFTTPNTKSRLYSISYSKSGNLIVSGHDNGASPTSISPFPLATLNKNILTKHRINVPLGRWGAAIEENDKGDIICGFSTSLIADIGGAYLDSNSPMNTKTVSNYGSEPAIPSFSFYGPCKINGIQNSTTGQIISFKPSLVLEPSEQAHLSLDPGRLSFKSNLRKNLLEYVVPGSDVDMLLIPGENKLWFSITDWYKIYGDQGGQLAGFEFLTGLTAGNTDNYTIYVSITGGAAPIIDIYKDSGRTQKVADFTPVAFPAQDTCGYIQEVGGSGIFGTLRIYRPTGAMVTDVDIVVTYNINPILIKWSERRLSYT